MYAAPTTIFGVKESFNSQFDYNLFFYPFINGFEQLAPFKSSTQIKQINSIVSISFQSVQFLFFRIDDSFLLFFQRIAIHKSHSLDFDVIRLVLKLIQ